MPVSPRSSVEPAGQRSSRTANSSHARVSSGASAAAPQLGTRQARANSGQAAPSSGGNIKVCVRVRPFNRKEISSQESRCVHVRSNTEVVMSDILEAEKPFNFDRAYDSSIDPSSESFASQETLMDDLGVELKRNSLEGYNSCLFAYGQSGSGKTHSVLGSPEAPGLLPRIVSEVFDALGSGGEYAGTFTCTVAYLEIYMEALRDLLAPPGDTTKLEIRNSPQVGVYVQNLKETPVFTKQDVSQLLEFGAKNRMVASTCMNDQSSRSHCIFTLEIRRKLPSQDGGPPQQLRSKLNLVDLAGSERQKRTQAAGGTLKEGAAINQSLSHLANVIFKLAEMAEKKGGKANGDFVPFRNSKLTMALMDSLGGNSKTIMIAALSPAEINYDETLSTLNFAKRVKVVKCVAKQNAESEGSLVARLKAECEQLKAQIVKGQAERVDNEQLEAMEALVEKYGHQDLESQLDLARQMKERRSQALKDLGLSSTKIGESIGLDESTPQLVNISNDPALVGCLVYFLTEGDPITVGSTKGCKIQLHGLGMRPTMAVMHNRDNIDISIEANEGRVLVNGQRVKGEQQLKTGDRLILGYAYCFRLMIPLATQDNARQLQQNEDLELALAEVVPSNSESYQKCKFFVREMQDRIGQEKAQSFLQEFGKVLTLVEEANAITKEVRPCEGLRFCAEVLTDVLRYQQEEPEVVIRLKRVETGRARLRTLMRKSRMTRTGDDINAGRKLMHSVVEEETYETVAVLDLASFERRLEKLRTIYAGWVGEPNSSSESEESSEEDEDPFGELDEAEETVRAERRTSSARASIASRGRVSVVELETAPMRLGRRGIREAPLPTPQRPSRLPGQELAGSSPAQSSSAGRRSQRPSLAQEGARPPPPPPPAKEAGRRASQAVLKAASEEHESDRARWTDEMQQQMRLIEAERAKHREAQDSMQRQLEAERRGWQELWTSQDDRIAQLEQVARDAQAKDARIAELEAQLQALGRGGRNEAQELAEPPKRNSAFVQRKLQKDGAELVEAARLASKLMRGLQGVRQGLLAEPGHAPTTPKRRSPRALSQTA